MANPSFGRGGRGELMRRALEAAAANRRPGEGDKVPQSVGFDNTGTTNGSGVTPKPQGRGAFLAKMMAQAQKARGADPAAASVTPGAAAAVDAPSVRPGRGRALLMQRGVEPAKPVSQPPTQPSSLSEKVVEGVNRLSVSEKHEREPVIKMGQGGKEVTLCTNYIRLSMEQGKAVYEYEVRFIPSIDSRNIRFKLVAQHRDITGKARSFDGAKLYLPKKLDSPCTQVKCTHPANGSDVLLEIIYKKKAPIESCTHLFNVLFRRVMDQLELTQIKRNYYDSKNGIPIPQHKLEVWPGYITAVNCYEGGILLNADVSHRVLRTQTALEIMLDIMHRKGKAGFHDETSKVLLGATVLTRYNNRTYRIDDIAFDQSPRSRFTLYTGEEISYMEYYKKNYGIEVDNDEQPLLVHRATKRSIEEKGQTKLVCLIPELCYMTGLTDDIRSDFRMMKDLMAHTRVTPSQRQATLRKYISNVKNNPKCREILNEWGFSLEDDIMQLPARVANVEQIVVGRGRSLNPGPNWDWGRDIAREHLLNPVELRKWVVVFTNRDKNQVDEFVNTVVRTAPGFGMNVNKPDLCLLNSDRTEAFVRAIRERVTEDTQIIVLICPTSRDDRYAAIKKLCCVDRPVASQVINGRTISQSNKLRSVAIKIALQMNCKIGGELWAVKIPIKDTMICGVDVYHDPTNRTRSVAGFVASMNPAATRWYTKVFFQMPGQELVDGLRMCLTQSLRQWYNISGNLPRRVMIYRDGVGDGQLETSMMHEVEQLSAAFSAFNDYSPKLSVVIVQKRINTRMFSIEGGGRLENPPPGTVLDHTVTRRFYYDFFLISQRVTQGTVSPTHYIVAHDDSGLKVEQMQVLAYKMTHMYYNWPGTVRVPAPCMYAHKVAFLIGQHVHKAPHEGLCDRLFFL